MLEVVRACPFPVSSLLWYPHDGTVRVTVVCKATFALRPYRSVIAPEQEPIFETDVYATDKPWSSLRYAADLVPDKARIDVVLVGHVHAPAGQPAQSLRARLSVGALDKALDFFCDPAAEAPAAAGFGPLGPGWPERRDLLGRNPPPGDLRTSPKPLPPDFDMAYFNAAPRDQQLDELGRIVRLTLEHLHPEAPRLITDLPAVRPVAAFDAPAPLPLRCDTLCIDTDRAICTMTFRGVRAFARAADVGRVVVRATVDETDEEAAPSSVTRDFDLGTMTGERRALPFSFGRLSAAPAEASAAAPAFALGVTPPAPASPAPPPPAPAPEHRRRTYPRFDSTVTLPDPPPRPHPTAVIELPSAVPFAPAPAPFPPPEPPPRAEPLPRIEPPRLDPPPRVDPPPVIEPPPVVEPPRVEPPRPESPFAASNEALGAQPADPPAAPPSSRPAPIPESTLAENEILELLWYAPESMARIRRRRPWRDILDEVEQLPIDPELDAPELSSTPAEVENRRDLGAIFTRAEPLRPDAFREVLAEGIHRGSFSPKAGLFAGELHMPWDEMVYLRALVIATTPLCADDERLRAAVRAAGEFLAIPGLFGAPAVAEGLTARIRDALRQGRRAVPADTLEMYADRAVLEQRGYQRRTVFGGPHLRTLLRGPSGQAAAPVYLPDHIAATLPLFQRFKARVLAEVHPPVEQQDPFPAAFRALALARVLPA